MNQYEMQLYATPLFMVQALLVSQKVTSQPHFLQIHVPLQISYVFTPVHWLKCIPA